MACFIVFEGGDGSGKSTQARSLLRRLQRRSIPAVLTHEPGGTPLGESLRRLLKSGAGMTPISELLLFEAARAQFVHDVVRPALAAGKVVIADRYAASTVAYQVYGRGLDRALVDTLNREATGGLLPDITIYLDVPVETALKRKGGGAADTFDHAPVEFHRRVRRGYLDQAAEHEAAEPGKWCTLDGAKPARMLGGEIWEKIIPFL